MPHHEILDSSNPQNVFLGVKDMVLENAAIEAEKSKWVETEINLAEDVLNFPKMAQNEQTYIKHILSFSVVSDMLVNANLLERFLVEVMEPSARKFLLFQATQEEVHNRTYGLMLNAICSDRAERDMLIDPERNYPAINNKIQWVRKWITSDAPFEQRLIAFVIVEGIFFSSLFCGFYWLRYKKSVLPGLIQANEFISRDETMHWQYTVMMLMRCPKSRLPAIVDVYDMINEAVDIECEFVSESLSENLVGMSASQMKQYVKFIADSQIIHALQDVYDGQLADIYNVENPFRWMESMSIPVLTNFFDRRHTQYKSLAGTGITVDVDNVDFNSDF